MFKQFRGIIPYLTYLILQLHVSDTCEPGWSYYNGHCFFISTNKLNNAGAKTACNNLGGYLAIIEDANEQNYVQELAMVQFGGSYVTMWIDGTDVAVENVWRDTRNGDLLPYLNFHSSQPSGETNAVCLGMHLSFNMQWDDAGCFLSRYFACEMEEQTSDIETSTTATSSSTTTTTTTIATTEIATSTVVHWCYSKSNKTQLEIEEEIEKIREELIIYPNATNKARRKLISIPDERPSAKSAGYIGLIILCAVFGLCVAADLHRIVKCSRRKEKVYK